jgi:hypothetical protein
MPQTIQMPRGLRAAEITPTSFDETDNTIECCWSAGATVRRMSWMDGSYDEELVVSANAVRLDRLNAGAPLLDTHASWELKNQIGVVVPGTARIQAGKGLARVQLSAAPGDADIVAKIKTGIVRNISVGYLRHTVEKTERDGQVPLWRVVDWEPYEISAVPVPADAAAQFRAATGGTDLFPCAIRGASPAAVARLQLELARRRRLSAA